MAAIRINLTSRALIPRWIPKHGAAVTAPNTPTPTTTDKTITTHKKVCFLISLEPNNVFLTHPPGLRSITRRFKSLQTPFFFCYVHLLCLRDSHRLTVVLCHPHSALIYYGKHQKSITKIKFTSFNADRVKRTRVTKNTHRPVIEPVRPVDHRSPVNVKEWNRNGWANRNGEAHAKD